MADDHYLLAATAACRDRRLERVTVMDVRNVVVYERSASDDGNIP